MGTESRVSKGEEALPSRKEKSASRAGQESAAKKNGAASVSDLGKAKVTGTGTNAAQGSKASSMPRRGSVSAAGKNKAPQGKPKAKSTGQAAVNKTSGRGDAQRLQSQSKTQSVSPGKVSVGVTGHKAGIAYKSQGKGQPEAQSQKKVAAFALTLEDFAAGFKIFIDISAMLDPGFPAFIRRMRPLMEQNSNKFFITGNHRPELESLLPLMDKRAPAQKALALLDELKAQSLIEERGEKADAGMSSGHVLLRVLLQFRYRHRLLLITQNREQAHDVEIVFRHLRSSKGDHRKAQEEYKETLARFLTPEGKLGYTLWEDFKTGAERFNTNDPRILHPANSFLPKGIKRGRPEEWQYFAQNFKIFLDTCSLMHAACQEFMKEALPALSVAHNRFILPYNVHEELQRHIDRGNRKPGDAELKDKAEKAHRAQTLLKDLLEHNLAELRGEKTVDNLYHADHVFLRVFLEHKPRYNLLVITQDTGLAYDLEVTLNELSTTSSDKRLCARRIGRQGILRSFDWDNTHFDAQGKVIKEEPAAKDKADANVSSGSAAIIGKGSLDGGSLKRAQKGEARDTEKEKPRKPSLPETRTYQDTQGEPSSGQCSVPQNLKTVSESSVPGSLNTGHSEREATSIQGNGFSVSAKPVNETAVSQIEVSTGEEPQALYSPSLKDREFTQFAVRHEKESVLPPRSEEVAQRAGPDGSEATPQDRGGLENKGKPEHKAGKAGEQKRKPRFKLCTQVSALSDQPLNVRSLPEEGQEVYVIAMGSALLNVLPRLKKEGEVPTLADLKGVESTTEQAGLVDRLRGKEGAVRFNVPVLTLGKALASGGEGSIFEIASLPKEVWASRVSDAALEEGEEDAKDGASPSADVTGETLDKAQGFVAKIYHEANITTLKYEKVRRMVVAGLRYKGICFPQALLFNAQGQFVGYLMEKAAGNTLQRSVFIKPLFMRKFPDWKKLDTVQLCLTILKKIRFLHSCRIIMGDINPENILVVDPQTVYFVDTDSYQIEDLPCPVGTVNYTAPEIQHKEFRKFLRTQGNENFAVATLLFMIMLPGKSPYAQQGGDDPVTNIINMDFSYPFGENRNGKTPEGPWRYIWSHLTYDLKKAFYDTFRKEGSHALELTRYDVNDWIGTFKKYRKLLAEGKLQENDPLSGEIFPNRLKKNKDISYITCKLCQREVDVERSRDGICNECLYDKGEYIECTRCHKPFLFSNYQRLYGKYAKTGRKPDICKDCLDKGKEVKETLTCQQCGRTFEFTWNDYYRLKQKDKLPRFCPECHRNYLGNRPTSTVISRPWSISGSPRPVSGTAPSAAPSGPSLFDLFKRFFGGRP